MKLRHRLFLFGAAIPTLCILAATLFGGWLFRVNALRDVDRALIAQAAVESVSMFDGPTAGPHLHLATSPLGERVRSFAPVAVIYDSTGSVLVTYPDGYLAPPMEAPLLATNDPVLVSTTDGTGQPVRRLWLQVQSNQQTYLLSLTSSLDSVIEATAVYHRVAIGTLLVMVLLIWLSQSALAANLSRRIGVMMAHLPNLEHGRLSETLPTDTTGDELSQLRAALNEASRQLARSRESEERFLANAAHELRTPLALLRTRLDLSLRKPRPEAELLAALKEARGDVDRLTELAAKLLEWAQPQEPNKTEINLTTTVAAMAEDWRSLFIERGLRLETQIDPGCVVFVDRMEIERAIANLIDNARKFATSGSTVHVCCKRMGNSVQIVVSSRGVPIPPADTERIFEPFVRGDVRQPGSGLGLALVRDAAKRNGGQVRVETDGELSCFTLEWNKADPQE